MPPAAIVLLIGPCMFVAPLLVLLIPLMVVLWPVVLAVLGAAWIVLLPVAAGVRLAAGTYPLWHRKLGGWFVYMLRPWQYFDVPPAKQPPDDQSERVVGG